MANKTFQGRIVQKHDTKANWDKATNFVPLKGEIIVYDDLKKIKIGDGTTKVGDLAFTNNLPIATKNVLGGIKKGDNVNIAADGTISVNNASTGQRGVTYLVDSYTRTDTDKAVTPKALNSVYKMLDDYANKTYVDDQIAANIPSISGLATETYVNTKVAGIVNSAPETLDTLQELASALGNDPNFATTMATEIGKKANSADLATVAKTGSYSDLKNKPTIPSVGNGTLTIQKNGTSAGTFTANATTDKTINIIVPTKVSELTDDVVKGKYLSLTGGTMTGNININNKTITNLKTPTANTEAANKKYVDDQIAANSSSTTIITWSDDGT